MPSVSQVNAELTGGAKIVAFSIHDDRRPVQRLVIWRRESFAKHSWVKLKRLSTAYVEFLDLWMRGIQKDVFLQRIDRGRDY